jgi:hypothetical protein
MELMDRFLQPCVSGVHPARQARGFRYRSPALRLQHDPEKCVAVFAEDPCANKACPAKVGTGFAKKDMRKQGMSHKSGNRFCEKGHAQNKELEQDGDSKKSHPALARSSRIGALPPVRNWRRNARLKLTKVQPRSEGKYRRIAPCE